MPILETEGAEPSGVNSWLSHPRQSVNEIKAADGDFARGQVRIYGTIKTIKQIHIIFYFVYVISLHFSFERLGQAQ